MSPTQHPPTKWTMEEILNGYGPPVPTTGTNTVATASIAALAGAIGAAVVLALFTTANLTPLPVAVMSGGGSGGSVTIPSPLPIVGAVSVSNFPSPLATLAVSNFPTPVATQPVNGAVSVSNFPAPQASIAVSNFPTPVSTVSVSNFPTPLATLAISNFPTPVATQPVSGSVSVGNFPSPQSVTSPGLTATVTTSASVLLVSILVVGANANRKGFTLWNNGANSTYCCFASTCTSSVPANIIATFTSWVYTLPYTGAISCIRNAGSGPVVVTELQ